MNIQDHTVRREQVPGVPLQILIPEQNRLMLQHREPNRGEIILVILSQGPLMCLHIITVIQTIQVKEVRAEALLHTAHLVLAHNLLIQGLHLLLVAVHLQNIEDQVIVVIQVDPLTLLAAAVDLLPAVALIHHQVLDRAVVIPPLVQVPVQVPVVQEVDLAEGK